MHNASTIEMVKTNPNLNLWKLSLKMWKFKDTFTGISGFYFNYWHTQGYLLVKCRFQKLKNLD